MVRISGVILPEKRLPFALRAIKGIGPSLSQRIVRELELDPLMKASDLNEEQEARLRGRIEKETVEGELTRRTGVELKRLQDIGSWRGHRHKKKLPSRGQTSRRNARTKRGKKKTGLSGRTTLTKT